MRLLILILLLSLFISTTKASSFTILSAESWPEGEALFRSDNRWLGADGATSLYLGKNRILWLFGDTFVGDGKNRSRKESTFVRNTIAIQKGSDPSKAAIEFYWKNKNGSPSSFFPEDGKIWHWPGGVIRIKDRLFIFLMAVRPTEGTVFGFGFEAFESRVLLVDNPDDDASSWNVNEVCSLRTNKKILIGSSSIIEHENFIYAYGSKEEGQHDIYLARWPLEDFYNADISQPAWWCGKDRGFLPDGSARPVMENGQTEFTIHYDRHLKCFIEAQCTGFGVLPLDLRFASKPEGPWSRLQKAYTPPETGRKDLILYAVKSHPELSGADLVLSYVTNSTDAKVVYADYSVYYPRLVKLHFK